MECIIASRVMYVPGAVAPTGKSIASSFRILSPAHTFPALGPYFAVMTPAGLPRKLVLPPATGSGADTQVYLPGGGPGELRGHSPK